MIRPLSATLMFLFSLSLASAVVMSAHDGHDHKVMGTITMAAADHVMLKTTDGKNVTIQVTKDTKVTRDSQTMKAQDIAVGARVVVTAVSENDQLKAKEIQVGAEARAAAR